MTISTIKPSRMHVSRNEVTDVLRYGRFIYTRLSYSELEFRFRVDTVLSAVDVSSLSV